MPAAPKRRQRPDVRNEPGLDSGSLPFSEAQAWAAVGNGWRQIFGGFADIGFSFEWHDFEARADFPWSSTFHPNSLEVCLNLSGDAVLQRDAVVSKLTGSAAGYYRPGSGLTATRLGGQRHQFITLELSREFLQSNLSANLDGVHPIVRAFVEGQTSDAEIGPVSRLASRQQETLLVLRRPPVALAAQTLWYRNRALDFVVEFLFQAAPENDFFCSRQRLLSQDRTQMVVEILRRNLTQPPNLEDLAREVGVSPFYLSRTFSGEMGMPINQYLRKLRLEKAAALLKSGEYNVSEAAYEVGYNSLSHFSSAFHAMFGCCPGLYPMGVRTASGRKADGETPGAKAAAV